MKSLLGKGAGYSMNPGLEPILPSQLIRKVINTRGADFTVRDLFKTFGSQSFGLIFIAMALPLTIPLPPLIGFIPAGLICTWALQRALGIIDGKTASIKSINAGHSRDPWEIDYRFHAEF
jgi:hypothetical protein